MTIWEAMAGIAIPGLAAFLIVGAAAILSAVRVARDAGLKNAGQEEGQPK
jgi:hypothetical protein